MVDLLEVSQLEQSPQALTKRSNFLAIAAILGVLIGDAFLPIMLRFGQIEVGPDAIVFNRLWVATAVLILWNGVGNGYRLLIKFPNLSSQLDEQISVQVSDRSQTVFLLLATGLFLTSMMVLWSWSLTQTSVANSALIHNLSPMFTTVGGWLFFKQRFHRRFLIGTAIALGGTIVLGLNDLQLDIDKIQGDIVSLVSSVAFAAYLISAERLRPQVSANIIIFWCFRLGILLTLPLALINHEQLFPISSQGWTCIGILGITTVSANFLLVYSLKELSASFVALVFLLDPILTSILAWGIFGETLDWLNLLAFSVILLGLFVAIFSDRVET
ncbi:MAG: DMT family transporter [Desmonostoc geniculatum HA4340-LM1]|jgi:drug/metabolite transporter (DMT)-like permease|nr:DMT family transporter [Desmonostoc geniculatum HA4340-LM1]